MVSFVSHRVLKVMGGSGLVFCYFSIKHLDLWDVKARPPRKRVNAPPIDTHLNYSHRVVGPYGPEADCQIPPCEDYLNTDPDYPAERGT